MPLFVPEASKTLAMLYPGFSSILEQQPGESGAFVFRRFGAGGSIAGVSSSGVVGATGSSTASK
jgi:hypothetical protein